MVAAQEGVVAFAGWVAGALYVSIDHPDGVRSTYSWVSSTSVKEGESVTRGQPIGATGSGHPGVATPHLHFGTLDGSTYLDPLLLLEQGSVAAIIHLAPLTDGGGMRAPAPLAAQPFVRIKKDTFAGAAPSALGAEDGPAGPFVRGSMVLGSRAPPLLSAP
jgi:hypothetical protein